MARRNRRILKNKKDKVIQKNLVRNILIVCVIIVFLFVIYRFNFSSKSKIVETAKVNFIEFGENSLLQDQEIDVEVQTDMNGNKYISWPETINGYYVKNYYVIDNEIFKEISTLEDIEDTNTILKNTTIDTKLTNTSTDTTSNSNTTINNIKNDTNITNTLQNVVSNTLTEKNTVEKISGLKRNFLTSQDISNSSSEEKKTENSTQNVVDNTDKTNSSIADEKQPNVNTVENTISNNTNTTTNSVDNSISTNVNNTTIENVVLDNKVEEKENSDINAIAEEKEEIDYSKYLVRPGTTYNASETEEKGKYSIGDVTVFVEYETITVGEGEEEKILYKQNLTWIDENTNTENIGYLDDTTKIEVIGFAPIESNLECTRGNYENLQNEMQSYEDLQDFKMLCAYDIKIKAGDEYFQPKVYSLTADVSLTSIDLKNLQGESNPKLIHFTDEGIETFESFETDLNSISFITTSFSEFAVVSENVIMDNKINIDNYTDDYNYYIGKNYTDNNAGTNQNIYTDDNLAKVVVNYHGNRENEYNDTGIEETETPIFTGETEEFTSTNLDYTAFQNIGNGSSTRYAFFSTTITLNDDSFIDRTKSWQITLTMNFSANYSVDSENPNRFNGYSINGNNITISDNNWDAWNGNQLELRILVRNSNNQRPNANNIRISNGMRLTATRQVVSEIIKTQNTYVTSLSKSDTGYISADSNERQNIVSYTKCVPIVNGKISFELIDNPFMDRPVGTKQYFDENRKLIEDKTSEVPFGFNGWSSNQYSPEISMNNSTKVQTLSTAITGKEIVIDLYANWEVANVVFAEADAYGDGSSLANPAGSWEDAISKLNQNIKRATNASDRELNIIVITGTYAFPDYYNALSSADAGYTVTSLYNGIDYRNNGAAIQISQSITLSNDLQLDFLNIEGPANYQSAVGNLNGSYINGNSKNLRIGRGMMPQNATNQRTTFSQVQSGGGNGQFRTVVESGKYSNIYTDRGNNGSTHNTNSVLIIGSDYDRVLENNDTLNVYARVSARTVGGVVTKTDTSKPLYDLTIKSGNIGIDSFTTYNNEDSTYAGIYVGGWSVTANNSTYDDGDRVLTVEGGNIANIVGGLTIASNHTQNTNTRIYIKGNRASVQNIVGGAGRSTTYGDRTIQVTGGTVQYSVCGGSNGVYSTNNDNGVLTGNTLLYIGGNANIGGNNRLIRTYGREDGNTLYGLQYGTVLGAGNGSATIPDAGIVTKTHIIVDGNAQIKNGVFGGGNYGSVRFDTTPFQENDKPVIEVTNYSSNFTTNENYLITSGTNSGRNLSVSGNNLNTKTFSTYTTPTQDDEWVLESAGNGRYYIKNTSTGMYLNYRETTSGSWWNPTTVYEPILSTNSYAFNISTGTGIQIYTTLGYYTYYYSVASNEFTTTRTTNYLLKYNILPTQDEDPDKDIDEDSAVTIDIFGGTVEKNVYGGSNQNNIQGNVKINMNNGEVQGTIYGGSNIRGTISKSTRLNIYGGIIGDNNNAIFAGGCGNQTSVTGKTILNIIDNNNNITINGDVYGGSEQGSVNSTTLVNISDIETNESKINLIGNVYGAGKGTDSQTATNGGNIYVLVDGGNYNTAKVFGGANINGIIYGNVKVRIGQNLETYVEEVYGGGNQAQVTSRNTASYSDQVYLYKNSTVKNAFNGGNQAGIADNFSRAIYAEGATVTNLYGGSNVRGDLNQTNVYCTENATIENVYGGGLGRYATVTGSTNIEIKDSTITNAVFGGGNAGSINNGTLINAENSIIENLYGGGLGETAVVGTNGGKTVINLKNTTVNENTFGGGDKGTVQKENTTEGLSTDITFDNSTTKNLYGGGRGIEATVSGTTKISLNNSSEVLENVYGGGDLAIINGGNTIVDINSSTIHGNVYGGGNGAETLVSGVSAGYVSGTTTVNIKENTTVNGNVFGGGRGSTATVRNDTNTNVLEGTTVEGNVYGGGDNGQVSASTNVNVNSATVTNVFGAGKGLAALVGKDTNVLIENVSGENRIVNDVYGGGELGTVNGSTFVKITSSEIGRNAYGAGKGELGIANTTNGMYALVKGKAIIIAEGNTTINGSLFGGGDASNIGDVGVDRDDYIENADANVYISGAIVKGNIYGGANRSKVWGNSNIYIGKKAIDEGYKQGEINIAGTVYGGGESVNEEVEFTYDFKSIHGNIKIDVDGTDYDTNADNKINIYGSIFGSGNASSAANPGDININNYGTEDNIKLGVSIQRANVVTIDKTFIKLSGTTDSTNKYAATNYTLNNIKKIELKNNSSMYLRYGGNVVESFYSLVDIDGETVPAQVTISEGNNIERNVDNRLYMYSGQKLNLSRRETVTGEYGLVEGMTFFGIYKTDSSGNIDAGMYDKDFNIGDAPTWDQRDFSRSYVLGLHRPNHDITKDGFYTVFEELPEDVAKLQKETNLTEETYRADSSYINYITPTPYNSEEGGLYMWYAGPDRQVYNYSFVLLASKYSTFGTTELNLADLSFPSATLTLNSFGMSNWKDGVNFGDKNSINNIETDQEKANHNLALTMKTSNTGWSDSASTDFFVDPSKQTYEPTNKYVEGDNYSGDNVYRVENSSITPTLNFYLYHSNNIKIDGTDNLGNYTISMDLFYKDGQDYGTGEVIIDISIKVIDTTDRGYNASITPGSQYDLFTATPTNITSKSSFSTFFELAQADFKNGEEEDTETIRKLYDNSYRVIKTGGYVLPENTTITMIDRTINGSPKYYYYNVKAGDGTEFRLSDFIAMGSKNEPYNESYMGQNVYYNESSDYQYESFIFIVNFENANFSEQEKLKDKITEDPIMTIELRAKDEEADTIVTLSSIIDYQLNNGSTRYNVYNGEAEIGVDANLSNPKLYVGFTDELNVNTTYTTTNIMIETTLVRVHDTQYFDKKLGVRLTLKEFKGYDTDGKPITGETIDGLQMLGTYFEIRGNRYYPRTDGSTRIKLAELVSNIASEITINAEKSSLVSGNYVLEIESYGSPDGIYFGIETSAKTQVLLEVVNDNYGLKSTIPDNQVIIDKATGHTLDSDGYISKDANDLNVTLEYASSLANPYVTVSLERRLYGDKDNFNEDIVYNRNYESAGIDLANYIEKNTSSGTEKFTADDIIPVLTKSERDMTESELLRKDRTEYEAVDTATLKSKSTGADIVGTFNLDYKILSPETDLTSGTYRLVYTLYDINNGEYQYIGEVFSYLIIK